MVRSPVTRMLSALALIACGGKFAAASPLDFTVPGVDYAVGDYTLHIGGRADGTLYSRSQPNAVPGTPTGVTGMAFVHGAINRTYDSGMLVALKFTLEAYHDRLSGDIYGNRFLEKLYGDIETGLGRVEVGETDGAAHVLSVTGPVVDQNVSLEDGGITFFRDPTNGKAFTNQFTPRTALLASLNYPKLSYYTPRLFGIEFAASFTPLQNRNVLPLISSNQHSPNRQSDMWEVVGSYSASFGDMAVGAYGALGVAHNAEKTTSHKGLSDWAFGAEAEYDVGEDLKFSVGGGFRQSNAYTFDTLAALEGADTHATHLSGTAKWGAWIIGGERTSGKASGTDTLPFVQFGGTQGSVGYTLTPNIQLTAGWERLDYRRSMGAYYSGSPRIHMSAAFFHIQFHVSDGS